MSHMYMIAAALLIVAVILMVVGAKEKKSSSMSKSKQGKDMIMGGYVALAVAVVLAGYEYYESSKETTMYYF